MLKLSTFISSESWFIYLALNLTNRTFAQFSSFSKTLSQFWSLAYKVLPSALTSYVRLIVFTKHGANINIKEVRN